MNAYCRYQFLLFSLLFAVCAPACVAPSMSCEIDPATDDCMAASAGGASAAGGTSSGAGNAPGVSGSASAADGGDGCHSTVAGTCHIESWSCGGNVCLCGIWIPEAFLTGHHVTCSRTTTSAGSGGSSSTPPPGDGGTTVPPTECSPTVLLATCTTPCGSQGTRGCTSAGTWTACTASEICNGADDDCDGVADDGNVCATASVCTPGQTGPCATGCTTVGTATCGADSQWISCIPPAETCGNGTDDNCNGQTDEACTTTPPATGGLRKITYRFTVPSPFPAASTLTVYDTAVDAQGNAVARAVPLGPTYGDIHYGWGSAFDDSGDVCYVRDSGIIECVVHRPAGTTLKVNTEAVFGSGTFWSCNGANGETFGLQEVFVDDVKQTLAWEANPDGPYLGCRFIVKI